MGFKAPAEESDSGESNQVNKRDDEEQLLDPCSGENVSESSPTSGESNASLETSQKKSGTIVRLLKLSLPDLPYVLAAFFFLLVACLSKLK